MGYKPDWSAHTYVTAKVLVGEVESTQHSLKIPGRGNFNAVVLTNVAGVCVVTGDYGNWVFCRQFVPSSGGSASPSYMDEKLRIASKQVTHSFDEESLLENAKLALKEELENGETNARRVELFQQVIDSQPGSEQDYFELLKDFSDVDHECYPSYKSRDVWLDIIYSAFDEMCRREVPNA